MWTSLRNAELAAEGFASHRHACGLASGGLLLGAMCSSSSAGLWTSLHEVFSGVLPADWWLAPLLERPRPRVAAVPPAARLPVDDARYDAARQWNVGHDVSGVVQVRETSVATAAATTADAPSLES